MRSPLPRLTLAQLARPALLLVLAAAVLSGGCGTGRVPAEVVVGLTAPLSGRDAATGAAFVRGCERAADEANASGGVRLRPGVERSRVRLEVRDDQAETPLAEQGLADLWQGGAVFALATPDGVRTIAQAVVAEREQRPLVVHPATSPGIAGARMRWVFALPRAADATAVDVQAPPPAPDEIERRAHATLAAALAALDGAGVPSPVNVRAALQSAR